MIVLKTDLKYIQERISLMYFLHQQNFLKFEYAIGKAKVRSLFNCTILLTIQGGTENSVKRHTCI